MKYGKFLLFILSIFVFSTCELERDNPLDKQNPNYDPNYYVPGGVDLKFSNCEIVQDNNGDGLLNPGETVYLKISLKNIGINNANGTSATFSSNSSYVSGLSPTTVSIGTINANSTVTPANSYSAGIYYTTQFTISSTTPIGTKIPINIHMSDGKGNSWDDSFEIVVGQTSANIKFSSFTIVKDNNENGTLNPGETAYLKISFKNSGSSKANSVSATFSSNSSYVSGLSPTTVSIGTINANSTVTPANSYSSGTYYTTQFTVSTSALIGAKIPISVHLTDTEGNSWDDSFEITIEQSTAKIEFLKYEIVKDGNENGALNPGETVYLKISFKNTGNGKANSVSATFSSNSSYASGLSPTTVSIGTINANSTVTPANSYSSGTYYTTQFTISTSALIGAKIPINVHLTDTEGNSWDDSFEIPVEETMKAKIIVSEYEIFYGAPQNDKVPVVLKLTFKNTSSNALVGTAYAKFSSSSSYVSSLTPTSNIYLSNMAAGTSETIANDYYSGQLVTSDDKLLNYGSYYTIKFNVPGNTAIGTKVPIDVAFKDSYNTTWTQTFNVIIE